MDDTCYKGEIVGAPLDWAPDKLLYARKSSDIAQTSIEITSTKEGIKVDITEYDQTNPLEESTTYSCTYTFLDIKYLDPDQSQQFIWYTHAEDTYVDNVLETFMSKCYTLYKAICAQ